MLTFKNSLCGKINLEKFYSVTTFQQLNCSFNKQWWSQALYYS